MVESFLRYIVHFVIYFVLYFDYLHSNVTLSPKLHILEWNKYLELFVIMQVKVHSKSY